MADFRFVEYQGLPAEFFKETYKRFGLKVKENGHFTAESETIFASMPNGEAGFYIRRLLRRHAVKARRLKQEALDAANPKPLKKRACFFPDLPCSSNSVSEAKPRRRATRSSVKGFFRPPEPLSLTKMLDTVAMALGCE